MLFSIIKEPRMSASYVQVGGPASGILHIVAG